MPSLHRSRKSIAGGRLTRAFTAKGSGVESTAGVSHFHECIGDRARICPNGMFPDNHHCPLQLAKLFGHLPVTSDVPVELGSPERGVSLGRLGLARWASMPEAAMHEHGNAFRRKHQIRLAREFGVDSIASSTGRPQRPAEASLKFRHPPVGSHGIASIQRARGGRLHRLTRSTHVLGKHRTCLGE